MFTSPILNAIATVGRYMYGHWPSHAQLVCLHRRLRRAS